MSKVIIMDTQRLRNLTTAILHTEMSHIYEDLETIFGVRGLMTHMLPNVCRAIEPWLREHVTDLRFWDGEFDVTHTGEYELPVPSDEDRLSMLVKYNAMPNLLGNIGKGRN